MGDSVYIPGPSTRATASRYSLPCGSRIRFCRRRLTLLGSFAKRTSAGPPRPSRFAGGMRATSGASCMPKEAAGKLAVCPAGVPARTRVRQRGSARYPGLTTERRSFGMPEARGLRRRYSECQESTRRHLSAKIRSAAPPRRRQNCNLRVAIDYCVFLLALPSCWLFHVALQFAGRRR